MSETPLSEKGGFKSVYNGQAIPRAQIPELPFGDFRRTVVGDVAAGCTVAALFGHPRPASNAAGNSGGSSAGDDAGTEEAGVDMYALLADSAHARLHVGKTHLKVDTYPSLKRDCPQVHLFEREIAEQFGIQPAGHNWFKPVRFHSSYRSGKDAWERSPDEKPVIGVTNFYRIEGDEIHEVAVGPVHAGVIEPGHFRFQCHGEEVFHLEISLGYQHRGAERTLVGGPNKRSIHTVETVAGDTSIGHATAYCQAIEALAGVQPPIRAEVLRGIALELERLANHTGDLGALAGDVAFLPTMAYCGRLRGDFLNLSALLCGNRFGRSMLQPGGVAFDLDDDRKKLFLERLNGAATDVENAADLLWNSASVLARFDGTGTVSPETSIALGIVGPAARASGVERDVRFDFPAGIYRFAQVPVSTWMTGDVFARAYVRWMEIQRSIAFIRSQLAAFPAGPVRTTVGPLKADHFVATLVEGWRGEICHVALTDEHGRFARYKIVDPSFHNWTALAMSLRDQQISDFPLCNKSFNLSYCGHDL